MSFTPDVRPICLPVPSLDPRLYDGKGVTLIGWGTLKEADTVTVNILARATLIIFDNE